MNLVLVFGIIVSILTDVGYCDLTCNPVVVCPKGTLPNGTTVDMVLKLANTEGSSGMAAILGNAMQGPTVECALPDCIPNPCGDGICTETDTSYVCQCPLETTGPICESTVNEMNVTESTTTLKVTNQTLAADSSVGSSRCCPTFWTRFKSHCYRFFAKPSKWLEAEKTCNTYSVPAPGDGNFVDTIGHLVSIHSEEERLFVHGYYSRVILETYTSPMWIGLNDVDKEKVFEWTDGSAVNFTYWGSGKPDTDTDTKDCTQMSRINGKWTDQQCDKSREFICKLPLL